MTTIFFLNWKKAFGILVAWVISVIVHNLFYAITGIEEPIFFIIATVIVPLYLIIGILYTMIATFVKHATKKRR